MVAVETLVHAGLALLSDGTLWCWGDGRSLVCPVVGPPQQLTEYPCLSEFQASGLHLVGLSVEGDVWITTEATQGVPQKVNESPAKWVAQGGGVVAWGADGAAWWGGAWDWLDWLEEPPVDPTPFPWGPIDGISLGIAHACFWHDGAIRCVGRNEDGQLGNGTTSQEPLWQPVVVNIPVPVRRVVAGDFTTYALDFDGAVWVWGANNGFDFHPATPVPAKWEELGTAGGLASGGYGECLWRTNGDVTCWGGNPGGLLVSDGTVPLPNPIPPTRVPDFEPAQLIDSYSDSPLCAIKFSGTLWCRGDYASGAERLADDSVVAGQIPFEDP